MSQDHESYIKVGFLDDTLFFMHSISNDEFSPKISHNLHKVLVEDNEIDEKRHNVVVYEFYPKQNIWNVISIKHKNNPKKVEYLKENLQDLLPHLLKSYNSYFNFIKYDYETQKYEVLYCLIAPINFLNIQEGTPTINDILYLIQN